MSLNLMKLLCETPGIPGREERVREVVKEAMAPYVDEIQVDALGNVIGIKRGTGQKKLMISGHMDEIGFLVKYIDDKGFLRIQPLGGFDPRNLVAQRVVVHGKEDLKGILMPGIKPKHLLTGKESAALKLSDFFIDIGRTKQEVDELVKIGDYVTMDRDFVEIGNHVCGKALDDRLGVYVMIEALKAVKDHEVDIYAVATVQEEVGLRGAITSAYQIKPDVGVALDVTLACDVPATPAQDHITKLGAGVAIKIMDSASISNYKLVDFMQEIAKRQEINYQMEILPRGGTDAGAIQRSQLGCPAITLSLPVRYVHSVVESAHKDDIKSLIALLAGFIEVAHEGNFKL